MIGSGPAQEELEELAERLGVSDRTVQRYEEGGCPEVVARLLAKLAEEEA